jgi:glycosyltransferase involved in cell wall biosynthesis
VEDGVTGWLVKPRDVGDLALKITAAIDAPAGHRSALQRNARLFIQQSFDERIVISAYLNAMPSRENSSRSEFISDIRSST